MDSEIEKHATRYELLRDIKIDELIMAGALPVAIEDAYDWFDAQVDEQIRRAYPNAEI